MELYYFKSQNGNFGDDLNPYLLEQLYPKYKEENNDSILIFIGTILDERFNNITTINDFNKRKKIVLGSGVRYINKPFTLDKTWEIRFLRGPLSSLFLKKSKYITDPAYLIKTVPVFKNLIINKEYKISIIPHYHSMNKLNWNKICKKFNIHLISPVENNVEFTTMEIAKSEMILTEAMHGAIVADALRVPWMRFRYSSYFKEQEIVSEFKWADWLLSMNLKNIFQTLSYSDYIKQIEKKFNHKLLKTFRERYIEDSLMKLLCTNDYQLSSDTLLDEKINNLMLEINRLNVDSINVL